MKIARQKVLIALIILGGIAALSTWYVYTRVPLVEFRPIHMNSAQSLQTSGTVLTEQHADNIESVLKQYGELYRRQDRNTVLITPKLSNNRELIWNFTTKAGI